MKNKLLAKAISITCEAFKYKFDKGGEPYFLHCLRVYQKVQDLSVEAQCAAIMHDLIEDHDDWTLDRLREEEFPERTIELVNLLTFPSGEEESYLSQISIISQDYEASRIKMSDIEDNSNIMRLRSITDKDLLRIEKYHKAYRRLEKRLKLYEAVQSR